MPLAKTPVETVELEIRVELLRSPDGTQHMRISDVSTGIMILEFKLNVVETSDMVFGNTPVPTDAKLYVSPAHGQPMLVERFTIPGLNRRTWDDRHWIVREFFEDIEGYWEVSSYELDNGFNWHKLSDEGYEVIARSYQYDRS